MWSGKKTMATELNFIILKINGFDVTPLAQNDTVQMFLEAQKEPIIIEMQRKCDDNYYVNNKGVYNEALDAAVAIAGLTNSSIVESPPIAIPSITKVASPPTHTAVDINAKLACIKISQTPSTASQHSKQHLVFTLDLEKYQQEKTVRSYQISKGTQTDYSSSYCVMKQPNQQDLEQQQQQNVTNTENAERFIEEEHNLFKQCLAPEIGIEEITLRKSAINERLGLTVCYSIGESNNSNGSAGSGVSAANNFANIVSVDGALYNSDDNEANTEVFISDIQSDSIAGRDGRLRQGDQILQINGKDVKTQYETESLIAENCNAVTLLVSRYLYVDDDDFNDPSVAELDVVEDDDVDVVEEDEEDEEDEEEYFGDNNFAYENCFIPTQNKFKNAVEELDKVLLQTAQQQQRLLRDAGSKAAVAKGTHQFQNRTLADKNACMQRIVNDMDPFSNKDSVAQSKVMLYFSRDGRSNAHLRSQKEQESKSLNNRDCMSHNQQIDAAGKQTLTTSKLATATPNGSSNADYDNEHIYETIPEHSEPEPFYCSPYESSMYVTAMSTCSSAADAFQLQQQQQKKQQLRVAQWLGLNSQPLPAMTTRTELNQLATRATGSVGNNNHHRNDTVHSVFTTITNGSSSSGGTTGNYFLAESVADDGTNGHAINERDNSSCAYNTGGSNNSGSPFILQLSQQDSTATHSIAGGVAGDDQPQICATVRNSSKQPHQRLPSPKHKKYPCPKSGALLLLGSKSCGGSYVVPGNGVLTIDAQLQQKQYSHKTVYSKESTHTLQAVVLQQHLCRQQQLQQQEPLPQQTHMLNFPEFTAPNLSQYHFVSSKEVSTTVGIGPVAPTVSGNTMHTVDTATILQKTKVSNSEESTTMVWKVKRRQDGTRYIVRRPAAVATTTPAASTPRNRLLRADRTLHMRVRSNNNYVVTATTEDDTISEVKTGRYWSKVERKRHNERARERRQLHLQLQQHLQQLQLQQNQSCDSSFIPTIRVDPIAAKEMPQQYLRTKQLQQVHISSTPRQITATKTKVEALQPQYYQLQFKSLIIPPTQLAQQTATPSGFSEISAQLMPTKTFTSDIHYCTPVEVITDTDMGTTTTEVANVTTHIADEIKLYQEQSQQCQPTNVPRQSLTTTATDATKIINDLLTIANV